MTGCDDIEADAVLFATGRVPNVEGLGLRSGRRRARRARARSRSTTTTAPASPSIFAVGDVTDRVQLTPVAIREGQAFADTPVRQQAWTGRL